MKRFLFALFLFFMLLFLLFFPQQALSGARYGLLLWYQNLVPVLFPFMILSNLMIQTDSISFLLKGIHPLFHLIWGTSVYGSYTILAGFLFGCPMGAKVVGDLRKQHRISEAEAEYLVCFVNNLSPVFVMNFLVYENLENPKLLVPTLGILYGAPLITGLLFSARYRQRGKSSAGQKNKASKAPVNTELIDACIYDGIRNITRLGAYIMLFSLFSEALCMVTAKNRLLPCMLCGILEITSGIGKICQSTLKPLPAYLCLMALCSFGGICAQMQTLSVCPMHGPMLRRYLYGKAATICISILLTLILFL